MYKEKLLMTPGPTMLPPSVLEVMRRQVIHHRTNEFGETWDEMLEDLKFVFNTSNPVLTLAASGTGGMESAVVNLFNPGETVLNVSIGNFGDRFGQIAEAFGMDVIKLSYPLGKAVNPLDIKKYLEDDTEHKIKGVLITHNETSTGVTNDIKSVAEVVGKYDTLLVVDAISSIGGLEIKMDEWGIDCIVGASQKALMAPPGLAFIGLSDKAWKAVDACRSPRFYWDYRKYLKGLNKLSENPPYTPAITTIMAQREALKLIRSEGLQNIYDRHKKLALAVQAGISALGLELLPDQKDSSYIITAVKSPDNIDIAKVIKCLNLKYDIMITGGQRELKGKIFRIGHCGYVFGSDLLKTFSALESALRTEGYKFEQGASLIEIQKKIDD
ncbi:MAG: alanine--glyoxylate aminotransferase family protein [Clostridiales bacterium]|jgi:aspartate aminotransferase-like enzyme|nr:alanine--glyoxylate aminotransferase family protein [Clostridiales bacterium]